MAQPELFAEEKAPQFVNCHRCHKRCRCADKVNPNANLFVKGTVKTGKYCAECLIVDFFKNCEIGPSTANGKEFYDHSIPWPEWRKEVGDPEIRFDPESLRLPHVQEGIRRIIIAAQGEYGAELMADEFDWDELIANWHLPFPEKKGRKRKGKGA